MICAYYCALHGIVSHGSNKQTNPRRRQFMNIQDVLNGNKLGRGRTRPDHNRTGDIRKVKTYYKLPKWVGLCRRRDSTRIRAESLNLEVSGDGVEVNQKKMES